MLHLESESVNLILEAQANLQLHDSSFRETRHLAEIHGRNVRLNRGMVGHTRVEIASTSMVNASGTGSQSS
jgi:hypothetical protein